MKLPLGCVASGIAVVLAAGPLSTDMMVVFGFVMATALPGILVLSSVIRT